MSKRWQTRLDIRYLSGLVGKSSLFGDYLLMWQESTATATPESGETQSPSSRSPSHILKARTAARGQLTSAIGEGRHTDVRYGCDCHYPASRGKVKGLYANTDGL